MSGKNLPAYLKQVLQKHVEKSELTHDEELDRIYLRLSNLNDRVEEVKAKAKLMRAQRVD